MIVINSKHPTLFKCLYTISLVCARSNLAYKSYLYATSTVQSSLQLTLCNHAQFLIWIDIYKKQWAMRKKNKKRFLIAEMNRLPKFQESWDYRSEPEVGPIRIIYIRHLLDRKTFMLGSISQQRLMVVHMERIPINKSYRQCAATC